jgi:hypothetical protein
MGDTSLINERPSPVIRGRDTKERPTQSPGVSGDILAVFIFR